MPIVGECQARRGMRGGRAGRARALLLLGGQVGGGAGDEAHARRDVAQPHEVVPAQRRAVAVARTDIATGISIAVYFIINNTHRIQVCVCVRRVCVFENASNHSEVFSLDPSLLMQHD